MPQLTEEQTKAKDYILNFLQSDEPCMILQGYAGTGKTYLINQVQQEYQQLMDLLKYINNQPKLKWVFTALTHKAKYALQQTTQQQVTTLYNYLNLKVSENRLIPKGFPLEDVILVVDECSYIDRELTYYLQKYQEKNPNSKIIYMGDKYQLPPIGHYSSPIFGLNYPTIELTQSVRQTNAPYIAEVCNDLRQAIDKGEMITLKPKDNIHYLERQDFKKQFLANAETNNIKFLAFTNKKVIQYNQMCMQTYLGRKHHEIGDNVIINEYVHNLPKDTELEITEIIDNGKHYLYRFKEYPHYLQVKKGSETLLRKSYALTIHKAQGQTYEDVYIDLSDLRHLYKRDTTTTARLLYVAFSRAKNNIYLTGDIA